MNLTACLSFTPDNQSIPLLENKNNSQPLLQISNRTKNQEEIDTHQPSQHTISKKIKIKAGNIKTEGPREINHRSINSRLKTSPQQKKSPLKTSNLMKKTFVTASGGKTKQFQSQWDCSQISVDIKENISCSELMHQPKKASRTFSRQNKLITPFSNVAQKSDDRMSSKSKNKIEFTVYQDRKRSNSKQNISILEPTKPSPPQNSPIVSIPYPCTHNIVIDLFRPTESRPGSKSKEKSLSRNMSKTKQSQLIHKQLSITKSTMLNKQKIQNALDKLSKFQIISDYTNKQQIVGMLQGYQLAGEPQCKWVLLVIDEIFRKMRKPDSA